MFFLWQIFRQGSFEKSRRCIEKTRQALTNIFSWRVEKLRKNCRRINNMMFDLSGGLLHFFGKTVSFVFVFALPARAAAVIVQLWGV